MMTTPPESPKEAVRRSHGHLFDSGDADACHISQQSPSIGYKKRALLVDDIIVNQAIVRASLHRASFLCDHASNGQQAVDLATSTPYDVILMDVQLPILDGVESTRRIREFERRNGRFPSIIYGLTGTCDEASLQRYNVSGMDGCFEKGCVVSRALHEALAMTRKNPLFFLYIDSRNVQSMRKRHVPPSVQKGIEEQPVPSNADQFPLADNVGTFQSLHSPCVVLLLDESDISHRKIHASLQQAGYACDIVSDTQSLIGRAKNITYSCALLDFDLPHLDGVQAAQSIRDFEEQHKRSKSAIFAYSSDFSEEDLLRCSQAGLNGCIKRGCDVARAISDGLANARDKGNQFLVVNSTSARFRPFEQRQRMSS